MFQYNPLFPPQTNKSTLRLPSSAASSAIQRRRLVDVHYAVLMHCKTRGTRSHVRSRDNCAPVKVDRTFFKDLSKCSRVYPVQFGSFLDKYASGRLEACGDSLS
jgi:hypothetical protein